MGGGLRSHARRVDRVLVPANHVIINRVFHERRSVWNTPKPVRVTRIFGKEKFLRILAINPVFAQQIVARFNDSDFRGTTASDAQVWPTFVAAPTPGIAKPERWQNLQWRRGRPAIGRRGAN